MMDVSVTVYGTSLVEILSMLAAVISAVAALALVWVAWHELRDVAKAFEQADSARNDELREMRKQIEVHEQGMRVQLLPVVVAELLADGLADDQRNAVDIWPEFESCGVVLRNIGPGPALDARLELWLLTDPRARSLTNIEIRQLLSSAGGASYVSDESQVGPSASAVPHLELLGGGAPDPDTNLVVWRTRFTDSFGTLHEQVGGIFFFEPGAGPSIPAPTGE